MEIIHPNTPVLFTKYRGIKTGYLRHRIRKKSVNNFNNTDPGQAGII